MNPEHWNEVIRVELGEYFTSSGFFSNPKTDDLIRETQRLKDSLENEGIFLPFVQYAGNSNLNFKSFRVIFGVNDYLYNNANISSVMRVLDSVARHYHLAEKPSADVVKNFVEKGNALLSEGEYNEAMEAYDRAYYWALIVNNNLMKDFINTVFNVGYIFFINNRLSDAYDCALILRSIVDSCNFHDPTTRYHVHMFQANLLWLGEHFDEATSLFQQCVYDVAKVNQPELMMLALYNEVCAYFATGLKDYNACVNALVSMDKLVIANPRVFSQSQGNTILRMLNVVRNKQVAQLQMENQNLRSRCSDLESKLSMLNLLGCAVRSVNGVLLTISAIIPRQMSFTKTIGELVVSGNTFKDEASVIAKLSAS